MRRVVMVSLNGNAYEVEEQGYEALRAYLDDAQQKLRDDPDCAEIIADLEQAVGEKCARLLDAHKSVIGTEELRGVPTCPWRSGAACCGSPASCCSSGWPRTSGRSCSTSCGS